MRTFRFLSVLFVTLTLLYGIASGAERPKKDPVPKKENVSEGTLLKRFVWDVPIENCELRNICDLKRLLFVADDYKAGPGANDYPYFTKMYATYETATFATLEKYAFVQFIRGTVFTSRKDDQSGKVEITMDSVLRNFNRLLVYRIPSWIIDSKGASPVYMSVEGYGRHDWYRWKKETMPPPGLSDEEVNIYGWGNPPVPRLYVDDDPQAAFVASSGVAYNVSLEFKTCLYLSVDIPQTTTRDNVDFAEPLYCFPWRSSYVYNHDVQRFESPVGIVFPKGHGGNVLEFAEERGY